MIDAAADSARGAIHQSRVRQLGTDKRLLYEIIREAGRLSAGEFHDRYEREPRVRSPGVRGGNICAGLPSTDSSAVRV